MCDSQQERVVPRKFREWVKRILVWFVNRIGALAAGRVVSVMHNGCARLGQTGLQ